MSSTNRRRGVAGTIADYFQNSHLTPLLAIIAVILGIFAVIITPKEEEPQIDVTFANVFIPFPGASVSQVESLVSTPAESVLSELDGLKHVTSVSSPGMAMLTVQFEVGVQRNDAILRLYNQIYSNADWLPPNLGVGQPLIRPMGIDDVPIVSVTLWSDSPEYGAHELLKVAKSLEQELQRVAGTRAVYTIGGPDSVLKVELNAAKMRAYGLDILAVRRAIQATNQTTAQFSQLMEGDVVYLQAGELLSEASQVESLVVGVHAGLPVYLSDVAVVSRGADVPMQRVLYGAQGMSPQPAVTIAVAKQPGKNATDISQTVTNRIQGLKNVLIPPEVTVEITRDYGKTASEKANSLIINLISATVSVVALLWLTLGRKQAFIVGTGVLITLLMMLFSSWAYGFTINRVSLFALIFSIGILVDDAIVVIENIHRHVIKGGKPLNEIIPDAVDEVGGPTILSTFTVISALMPMAFVSGLMGPYMGPVPINATMGMIISNVVAFVVIPWMALRMFRHEVAKRKELAASAGSVITASADTDASGTEEDAVSERLEKFFGMVLTPFLRKQKGRFYRWLLLLGVLLLMAGAVALPAARLVVLKMLPFDNKSEFQIVVDMPESTPIEVTQQLMLELGDYLTTVDEVENYQIYAGTASPINFNGLVRQYYLRSGEFVGDIQVNLKHASLRKRKSHEIAQALRADLQKIGRNYGGNVKIVEVPPGPPVQFPIVAEVYGPDYDTQIKFAAKLKEIFAQQEDLVDIDDSVESVARRILYQVDRERAARMGLSQHEIVSAISAALQGEDVSYLHEQRRKHPVPIRVGLAAEDKFKIESVLDLSMVNQRGEQIFLADLVTTTEGELEKTIHHKDLLPVVYVTADMSGDLDSPLYGMFSIAAELWGEVTQFFVKAPSLANELSIKWDGEWQITYETFRDMGIAYLIGVLFIYFFVVVEFKSYKVPLIIMVPIPLTIVGVLPGHLLFGEQFTATSMIGMIALGGIIVRNSILLVDFIDEGASGGLDFQEAVIKSGAVRAKPIVLTGLSTMVGSMFMLGDPIFSGLAVALISGVFVSTILTLVIIPVLYYATSYKNWN